MKSKRVNVSLPTETLEKLKNHVPEGKRSQYIAKILEKDLKDKMSLKKAIIRDLRENRAIYEEAAKEWSVLDTEGWPPYDDDDNEDQKR